MECAVTHDNVGYYTTKHPDWGNGRPARWALGARKEESDDSDIDFLVDFNSLASLLNQVHLRDEFQEMFGRGVDVVSSRGLSPFLSKRILSEAVPV